MDARDSIELVAGRGVAGSADQGGRRQVTLLEREVWDALMRELGSDAEPETRRANVLVSGIDLRASRGRELRVGGARVRVAGEVKPCERMEAAVAGLRAAMFPDWRGGAFAEILDGGDRRRGRRGDVGGPVGMTIEVRSTRLRRLIPAPRARVYQLLLDATALPHWKVPDGMDLVVHQWEPREGGRIRVSLTYRDASAAGKSDVHTDTYHGQFVRLVPNELIVERDEFETDDPAFRGAMTISIALRDVEGATELVATHDGVPAGVRLADNETGWRMALDKLAELAQQPLVR